MTLQPRDDAGLCRFLEDRHGHGSRYHQVEARLARRLLMSRDCVIRYSRGEITIVDGAGLESRSCECYGRGNQIYAQALDSVRTRRTVASDPASEVGLALFDPTIRRAQSLYPYVRQRTENQQAPAHHRQHPQASSAAGRW